MWAITTNLRLIALSSCQGMLEAPRTKTPSVSLPTPFICTRNSVLILRDASDSPSPRVPQSESTSSMKIMAGLFSRAILNNCLTSLYKNVNKRALLCCYPNVLHWPLTLTHPFRYQIRRGYRKEGAVGLRSYSFCQKRFTSSWRSVQKNTSPWYTFSSKQMRKLDGQDDSFFKSFFCSVQSGNIIPTNIGFFRKNST